jgi:transcription elongation factor GreA
MDKVPMTAEGHRRLEEELHQLKSVERGEVIRAIAEAREHGDLSENAEYHAARERQGFIEGRIQQLEDVLSRAEVINPAQFKGDKAVKFGATVKLIDEDTEEEVKYQIVGELESDIKAGKLSVSAPIARALIGKQQGDRVEVTTPRGTKAYEIEKVLWA